MGKRILVGYATGTGSTAEVAGTISESLLARGYEVDLRPLADNPSPAGYDAVILGSAVNGARWRPEALDYVRTNQTDLAEKTVAAFCVHGMNAGDSARATRRRRAYLSDVRELVPLADEVYFTGLGLPADTSRFARWAYMAYGGVGEGDFRDWDAIRKWGSQVQV